MEWREWSNEWNEQIMEGINDGMMEWNKWRKWKNKWNEWMNDEVNEWMNIRNE